MVFCFFCTENPHIYTEQTFDIVLVNATWNDWLNRKVAQLKCFDSEYLRTLICLADQNIMENEAFVWRGN